MLTRAHLCSNTGVVQDSTHRVQPGRIDGLSDNCRPSTAAPSLVTEPGDESSSVASKNSSSLPLSARSDMAIIGSYKVPAGQDCALPVYVTYTHMRAANTHQRNEVTFSLYANQHLIEAVHGDLRWFRLPSHYFMRTKYTVLQQVADRIQIVDKDQRRESCSILFCFLHFHLTPTSMTVFSRNESFLSHVPI